MRAQAVEIGHHRFHEAAALGPALERGNAGAVILGAQPHRFGRDLEPALDQRPGVLEQGDLVGIVAEGALELGQRRRDVAACGLEIVVEPGSEIDP